MAVKCKSIVQIKEIKIDLSTCFSILMYRMYRFEYVLFEYKK